MTLRTVDAPAKINLGLEILGRRDDGFHEIRSVLCKVSLHDTLTFAPASDGIERVLFDGNIPYVPDPQNLILLTLDRIRSAGVQLGPQLVSVTKRIPAAAGLGGASSDAAATIQAFSPELARKGVAIEAMAASLGSDVPFFLMDSIAIAAGRGIHLTPLPVPDVNRWIVLVTPHLDIPNKTASMYSAIETAWWSSGSAVESFAALLPTLGTSIPPNVFERALLKRYPSLSKLRESMRDAGASCVALTGAGPTFYTMESSEQVARDLGHLLRGDDRTVHVTGLGWSEPHANRSGA